MNPANDPPRLFDADPSTPSFLREALGAARNDLPSAEMLARIAQRLPMSPGPSGGGGSSGPAPAPSPRRISRSTLARGGVAAVVVAALLVVLPSRQRATETLAAAPAAVAMPAPPASQRDEGAPQERHDEPEPASPPAAIAPSLPAPTPRATVAPSAVAVEGESEIALLQRAQDALGSAPARALALTDEHRTRFRAGALAQEREVLAISALTRMGRTGDANARAASFLARYPSSAHRRRIEALLPSVAAAAANGSERTP